MIKYRWFGLMLALLLSGCGHSNFTSLPTNPNFIVITKYVDGGANPGVKSVHDASMMNTIVSEINEGQNHILRKGETLTCPNARSSATYDIVLHYQTAQRTFVLTEAGCTFLNDEKDGLTMYADVPDVSRLFN